MAGCLSSHDRQKARARNPPIIEPPPTRLLGFTSPAVDAAPCAALDDLPLATDQRGVVRPQGATCDIGAVEVVPPDAFAFVPLVRQ